MTSGVRTRARSYRAPGARAFAEMPRVELQHWAAPFPVTVGHDGGGPGDRAGRAASGQEAPLCRRCAAGSGGPGVVGAARGILQGGKAKGGGGGETAANGYRRRVRRQGGGDVVPGGGAAGDGYSGCQVNPTLIKDRVLSRRRLVAGTSWTMPGVLRIW